MEGALIGEGEGGTRSRHPVVVFLAYAAVTLVLAGPFVNYTHLGSALYRGDTRLIVWT